MTETKKISRRDFLKRAAVGGAALTVSCIGLSYAGTIQPEIDLPEYTGENMQSKRVLVTYATRTGSTAEVAQFIQKQLTENGCTVDLKPLKEIKDLQGYNAVVVGSPIRMGKWVGEASEFLQTHNSILTTIPTAAFTLCMPQIEDHQEAFRGYLETIKENHNPDEAAFFLGTMRLEKLSFLDRMISKALKAKNEDKRDWDQISTWVNELPSRLNLN